MSSRGGSRSVNISLLRTCWRTETSPGILIGVYLGRNETKQTHALYYKPGYKQGSDKQVFFERNC